MPQNGINFIEQVVMMGELFKLDSRLSPWHVSLYYALFQVWNQAMFYSPISIARAELMKASKIGSTTTYHKCITQLSEMGYIKYEPSHNPMKGSLVYLFNIETTAQQLLNPSSPKMEQLLNKNCTALKQLLIPYINNNKHKLNNTNKRKGELHSPDSPRKTQKRFSPPSLNEVIEFFKEKKGSTEDAEKFFNHFESNGWKVGGRTAMKDWNAAARNWMLRSKDFTGQKNQSQTNRLNVEQNKNYGEPL